MQLIDNLKDSYEIKNAELLIMSLFADESAKIATHSFQSYTALIVWRIEVVKLLFRLFSLSLFCDIYF